MRFLVLASFGGAAALLSGAPAGRPVSLPTCTATSTTPGFAPISSFAANSRLEVAAEPRASPKAVAAAEPLNLWGGGPAAEEPSKGPSHFQLNRGRAIDTLRRDYPRIFDEKPDLTIFSADVELHDPSGKRLAGISQYERVFDMFRFLRRTTMQDVEVTHRIIAMDDSIRVRWNAKLWMRDPATGITKMANGEAALVQVDGVSIYDLHTAGDKAGLIRVHRLDDIVFTGAESTPAINLPFAWPAAGVSTPELAMPFFRSLGAAAAAAPAPPPGSSFAIRTSPADGSAAGGAARGGVGRSPAPQACAARETPMERAAREREEDASKAAELKAKRAPKEEKSDGAFSFGKAAPRRCKTSYDCDSPLVCCDVLFTKVCCGGGMMMGIPSGDKGVLQRQAIPIPVEKDPPFPGGGSGLPPRGYPSRGD